MKSMPLSIQRVPFDDPDWLHEIKCDGFRGLAYVFGSRCQLVSRTESTRPPEKRLQASVLRAPPKGSSSVGA